MSRSGEERFRNRDTPANVNLVMNPLENIWKEVRCASIIFRKEMEGTLWEEELRVRPAFPIAISKRKRCHSP